MFGADNVPSPPPAAGGVGAGWLYCWCVLDLRVGDAGCTVHYGGWVWVRGDYLEGDGLAGVGGGVVLEEHRENVLRPTCKAGVIHHEYLPCGLRFRVKDEEFRIWTGKAVGGQVGGG